MERLPKVQLHRNGLLVVAGIVLLVALVGAVQTVALMRAISVVVVIAAFVEIVVHLLRRRELRTPGRLFDSQSTLNATRYSKRQQ